MVITARVVLVAIVLTVTIGGVHLVHVADKTRHGDYLLVDIAHLLWVNPSCLVDFDGIGTQSVLLLVGSRGQVTLSYWIKLVVWIADVDRYPVIWVTFTSLGATWHLQI